MKGKQMACVIATGILVLGSAVVLTKDSISEEKVIETAGMVTQNADGSASRDQNVMEACSREEKQEIEDLIGQYYEWMADGNVEAIRQITPVVSEAFQKEIESNHKFVETYQNLKIHMRKAKIRTGYAVFVEYEMKIRGIDTPVPGLGDLYVCQRQDGTYWICNSLYDKDAKAVLAEAAKDGEVKMLVESVEAKFEKAKEKDKILGGALTDLEKSVGK